MFYYPSWWSRSTSSSQPFCCVSLSGQLLQSSTQSNKRQFTEDSVSVVTHPSVKIKFRLFQFFGDKLLKSQPDKGAVPFSFFNDFSFQSS